MAKNTASISAKITGSTYSAAEFEILRGFVDSPLQDLSTFDGSLILLDGSGSYDNFTMSANLEITFAESAHVEGSGKIVKITADGTDTLTFTKPSAYNLYYPSTLTSGAVLASGIHVFSFWFIGGEIEVHQTTLTSASGDVTAPTMTSRTIENAAPLDMVMVFDEVVTGTNLGFTINGTTSTVFASISGSGTNTITGTMAAAAVFGETITLDYSSVSGDIVDGNSNALVTFSGAAVTNNVADVTAPTMTSATIENATDSVLDFIFSDAVTITTAGWNIDTDGAALSISSVLSGSGTTTPKFQLSRSVLSTETLNVDYDSVTGATVKVSNSVELVTFTNTAVTNNVASGTIILVQDAFDDSSIDTGIWTELVDANGSTVETTVLTLSASAATSSRYGLYTTNGYTSSNDLLIAQCTVTHADSSFVVPRFAMTATQGDDDQDRALILNANSSPYDRARLITNDGGSLELNEISSQTYTLTERIKYVPSTGAITFEYWNGSAWASLGSGGNVDLGTTIYAYCFSTASASDTDITFSDFFISEDNYSTEFPT